MFSIYDLHGQKVKRHDLQMHKHGRWDDSINMAAQWPSLHAANPPKMASTKSASTNIVGFKILCSGWIFWSNEFRVSFWSNEFREFFGAMNFVWRISSKKYNTFSQIFA